MSMFATEVGYNKSLEFALNAFEKLPLKDQKIFSKKVHTIVYDGGSTENLSRIKKCFPRAKSLKLYLNKNPKAKEEIFRLIYHYGFEHVLVFGKIKTDRPILPPKCRTLLINNFVGCPCCMFEEIEHTNVDMVTIRIVELREPETHRKPKEFTNIVCHIVFCCRGNVREECIPKGNVLITGNILTENKNN